MFAGRNNRVLCIASMLYTLSGVRWWVATLVVVGSAGAAGGGGGGGGSICALQG